MVFLTATLPPKDEPEFMNIMKVCAEDVHILRASTSRPNIEYSVIEYNESIESISGLEPADAKSIRAI